MILLYRCCVDYLLAALFQTIVAALFIFWHPWHFALWLDVIVPVVTTS